MKTERVEDHLREKLKDPYFKELYELDQQKLAIVKPIIGYRIKHKLSQTGLAKITGVTQQHISKIEQGEFSNLATLEKVLSSIGFTVRLKVIPAYWVKEAEKREKTFSKKNSLSHKEVWK